MQNETFRTICALRLPPQQKAILFYLAERMGSKESCWPSQARIAADIGVHLATVKRALLELRESGILAVGDRHGKALTYTMTLPSPDSQIAHGAPSKIARSAPPDSALCMVNRRTVRYGSEPIREPIMNHPRVDDSSESPNGMDTAEVNKLVTQLRRCDRDADSHTVFSQVSVVVRVMAEYGIVGKTAKTIMRELIADWVYRGRRPYQSWLAALETTHEARDRTALIIHRLGKECRPKRGTGFEETGT
jgi:hypothetical protein